jgi:hypothetical protein
MDQKKKMHHRTQNYWVQATLDYAFCGFLSRWPSAPDPARSHLTKI